MLKSAKTALFDWTTLCKNFISIIKFSRGKTDHVRGSSFMLSSVVEFGQISGLQKLGARS